MQICLSYMTSLHLIWHNMCDPEEWMHCFTGFKIKNKITIGIELLNTKLKFWQNFLKDMFAHNIFMDFLIIASNS